ncbi:DUF4367 domain-containing protein [Paenibacillus glycanilyticus]|uniref:DUF4367 domain-containing protein n=1 Tax=Paenibacillus glycanilyticus TaxID=126569 RepID=UPI00203FF096|nr:DUF4367 domain-containing protein [Paenibacillus glycanilyticus]MCM3625767.1 DUF4367 domain-containing protein [Paenibacillus glycanilyticus]
MRRFLVSFIAMMFFSSTGVQAEVRPSQALTYHKLDATTQDKVKNNAAFKLLVPKSIPNEWTVELKYPYPLDTTKPIQRIILNYFDKEENFMFGLEQHNAVGYIMKKEVINIDARTNKSSRTIVEEEFKFDTSGERLDISGIEARFTPWADKTPGGYLRWVQDGTYIEMLSYLPEKNMLKIAQSVK